jgi:hypothetical protein
MERLQRRPDSGLLVPEHAFYTEKRLWTSPDIAFVDTFTLTSGEQRKAHVQFTDKSLPPGFTLEDLHKLKATPRSRYGQVFVEVEHIAQDLEEYFRENGLTSLDDIDISTLHPEVTIVNYATRPNIIREGGGVFRIYDAPAENQLIGDALLQSTVRVDGKPISPDMVKRNQKGEPVALRLQLDPKTRRWIPPNRIPINLDPFNGHQREQIDELLQPVPQTEDIIPYLVYSKEELEMPEGMFGIVGSYGYADTNGKATLRSMSTHGTSQLFDPGRTWKMIFELRGKTVSDSVANFIDVFLYKTAA